MKLTVEEEDDAKVVVVAVVVVVVDELDKLANAEFELLVIIFVQNDGFGFEFIGDDSFMPLLL
jgi:hypothetical protein